MRSLSGNALADNDAEDAPSAEEDESNFFAAEEEEYFSDGFIEEERTQGTVQELLGTHLNVETRQLVVVPSGAIDARRVQRAHLEGSIRSQIPMTLMTPDNFLLLYEADLQRHQWTSSLVSSF